MFPFRDHNPSRRTPYVNWILIAINVIVFLAYTLTLTEQEPYNEFLYKWGMIPAQVVEGNQLHTAITCMFLHGGWMHIGGNMMFLWIFGDNMEDSLGHIGYLVFYLIAGLGAGAAHVASDPGSMVTTVGASGAVAGVMGGYILFYPKAKVDVFAFLRVFTVPAWLMLGAWFFIELFRSLQPDPSGGGVAHWAHTGGWALGLLCAAPFWWRRGGTRLWRLTLGVPPHPPAPPVRLLNREIPGSGSQQP